MLLVILRLTLVSPPWLLWLWSTTRTDEMNLVDIEYIFLNQNRNARPGHLTLTHAYISRVRPYQ